jgi:hypothetical protein
MARNMLARHDTCPASVIRTSSLALAVAALVLAAAAALGFAVERFTTSGTLRVRLVREGLLPG